MEEKDLLFTPFYFLIFYAIAAKIRKKHFGVDHPFYPYFMRALTLKFIGAIGMGMIYFFYYGYGDTTSFFFQGRAIYNKITENISFIQFFIFPSTYINAPIDVFYTLISVRAWDDPTSYFIASIVGFISLLTFNIYSSISLFFAFFSFMSSLYLYKTLIRKTPGLEKQIAIALFFIPSVYFWGSSINKDSVAFSGLLIATASSFNILDRYKMKRSITLLIIGCYLILNIKPYILLCMAPCFGLYIFIEFNSKIKSDFLKKIFFPLFLTFGIISGYFFLQQISAVAKDYSLENVQKKALDMQQWHSVVGEGTKKGEMSGGGSSYSIGTVGDFSILGMIKSIPLALSFTFYRPFIWEVNSPVMLFACLEGIFFIYITIKVFRNFAPKKIMSAIVDHPIIALCLLYSLLFGFAVGYTSFNYGALVRYKIPCLPFYLLTIYYLNYYLSKNKNST